MNVQRDPDAVLAAWLEEGPNRLPELTRRAISFTTRTTEQQRRSPWAPWRTSQMPMFARIALATVAVIALIGGAAYFIGPQHGAVGAPPSPSPSVTPTPSSPAADASVPIDWTTYTSNRFAYVIDYPSAWHVTPATLDWPSTAFPDKDGPEQDVFAPSTSAARVFVSSVPLKAGKLAADWVSELDSWNAIHSCQLSASRTITIDGASARRQDGVCMGSDQLDEVVMADGKRFYQINLMHSFGAFTDTDRAIFDRFLASFRFSN